MKKIIIILSLLFPLTAQAQSRCYFIGDSIAQGVSKYSQECGASTRVGLNTNDAHKFFTSKGILYFDNLVISLGINDSGQTATTIKNLLSIRSHIRAKKVVWILPNQKYPVQNYLVKKIAMQHGDSYIDVTSVVGKDGIHPTASGYQRIATTLKTQGFK